MQLHEKDCATIHESLRKGVNQLTGDPNYETTQWLRGSYCQKTTLEASCAQGVDPKSDELIDL